MSKESAAKVIEMAIEKLGNKAAGRDRLATAEFYAEEACRVYLEGGFGEAEIRALESLSCSVGVVSSEYKAAAAVVFGEA